MSEVVKLTDYQIFSIYFWPTDKEGKLQDIDGQQVLRQIADPQHLKLQMALIMSKMGATEAEIDAEFRKRYPGWSV